MAKKQVKKEPLVLEEPISDDSAADGDEIFEGLESMSTD